ncbi:hypothetical protein C8J57DRAFT_1238473 [Mycena rebaudengoi]|nr:hypothetical protein C8J57DRAFT_1238473 [Mycena rebaudengoi]
MHLFPTLLAMLALAVSAQAAPGGAGTSSTKRCLPDCVFEFNCPCTLDPDTGCTPQFDTCEQLFYWPPACGGCGTCVRRCLDPGRWRENLFYIEFGLKFVQSIVRALMERSKGWTHMRLEVAFEVVDSNYD